MKYCEYCKVDVNENLENCPLCGSYLSRREGAEDGYYAKNIQPLAVYPKLVAKTEDNNNFLQKKFLLILIFVVAACVAINLLIVRGSLWSAYVGISAVVLYACVITSIYRRSRLYSILFVSALFVSLSFAGYDIVQRRALRYARRIRRVFGVYHSGIFVGDDSGDGRLAVCSAHQVQVLFRVARFDKRDCPCAADSHVERARIWKICRLAYLFVVFLFHTQHSDSVYGFLETLQKRNNAQIQCLKGGAKAPAFNFFISKIQDTSTARRTSLCAPLRPLLCTRLFLLSIGL